MKQRTVRGTLLGTYTIVILVSFFALAALFATIQISRVRMQTFATLEQNTQAAATTADREIDQMRTMALNISYSTRMQDRLFVRQASAPRTDEAEKLSTLLSLLVLPNRPIDQVNLYTLDGMRVSSGIRNEIAEESAQSQSWYQGDFDTGHQMLFFSGTDDDLSKYVTGVYGKQFVSLVIENYDNFNNVCGYIEIKHRVSRIISFFTSYEANFGERIYFFDKDGTQIYPAGQEAAGLFQSAQELHFPQGFERIAQGGSDVHICCAPSNSGNFYTVMVLDHADLLRPVWEQLATIFVVTLMVLALAIVLSHLASRRITAPIDTICQQIGSIDIEHPTELPPLETDIAEMRTLHGSFAQMQSTLSEHVGKLLLLQKQEMQSRMLALQAQMNPHFLFNSLAALQAMSDEGMNEEISEMCQAMASILRYISSDSAQEVPLEDELKYTVDYLTCMAIRYPGDLSYEIDVPEELNGVAVPKLCVQLLVENAIKFTTTQRPPYRIRIAGLIKDNAYELRIQDNGPGFSKDTLDALSARMEEIRRTSVLPSLKIDGMGILNVFIRFCLLYDNQFIFRLENNPEGGASIVIGANRNESEI